MEDGDTAGLEAELTVLRDRSARTLADFENYRKRVDRERADERRYAAFDLLRGFLEIVDNLDAVGVAPDDVTDVVFTHAHPDHIWGVLDDFDEPLFFNATHHIGQAEADYWLDPATLESIGEDRASFAVGAKNRIEAIEDSLSTFFDGDTIAPGITARATFGHTPGHMGFMVEDRAMIVGDAIGNGHLALERPDWPSGADQEPETGIATRTELLAELADTGLLIVGFHLPSGGMGRIETAGDIYRCTPEAS